MRSSPTSTRLLAAAVLSALLGGCQEATIVTPTPAPTATATATLPPLGYNHRYGNDPLAAADAFRLERALIARGEYWELAISTEPAAAGDVEHPDPTSLAAARGAARTVSVTIATEIASTIRGLLAGGHSGQQAYCLGILDQVRALGYSGLRSATVDVYFTERDRHAELTWSASGATTYTVFDNDLGGDVNRLPGGTTPFPAPPTP